MQGALDQFLERVNDLMRIGVSALQADDPNEFHRFRSGSLSLLQQLYGTGQPFFKEFNERVLSPYREGDINAGIGILRGVKTELEGGWLLTARGLISAEIFSDYLEMARYLIEEGYKDAAAVITGSTLESHLRQLCNKNGIAVDLVKGGNSRPKPADLLNSDLAAANVYSKLDQKNVTAWLDLRNKAAHGKYDEYTKEQVQLLIQSVVNFVTRNPV